MAFTVARDGGKCNICRRSLDIGQQAQTDPNRPKWTDKNGREHTNYVHVSCVKSGQENMQSHAPAPQSYAPKNGRIEALLKLRSGLALQIEAVDALIAAGS